MSSTPEDAAVFLSSSQTPEDAAVFLSSSHVPLSSSPPLGNGAPPERRYTLRERRKLMLLTQELGATEHAEIFKILQGNGVSHTQNNNGVFVNLSRVPDAVLEQVDRFVGFCIDNKHDLDEYDKRLNECKLSNNYDRFLGPSSTDAEAACAPMASRQPQPAAAEPYRPFAHAPPASVTSIAKRIMNSKFHQATKRFSKRRVADRKASDAVDLASNELVAEPYSEP